MRDMERRRMTASGGLGLAAALLVLGGCSGGMTMPPTIAAMISDSPSQPAAVKTEVTVTELMQPGPLPELSVGKTTAPVTIIQYVSLSCESCVRFQSETLPKLRRAYIDKGKVRLIVREFPTNSASVAAAVISRCVPEKEHLRVTERLLATQKSWGGETVNRDELYKAVKFTGLKRNKFDECLANQSINDALVSVKQRGASFGVADAPTFFVNGKRVAGAVSFEEMKTVIEAALPAPASPAGQPQAAPGPQAAPAKAT